MFDITQSFFDVPYIHALLKTWIQSSHNEPTRNMLQLKKYLIVCLWIYENLRLFTTEEYTGTADNGNGNSENGKSMFWCSVRFSNIWQIQLKCVSVMQ